MTFNEFKIVNERCIIFYSWKDLFAKSLYMLEYLRCRNMSLQAERPHYQQEYRMAGRLHRTYNAADSSICHRPYAVCAPLHSRQPSKVVVKEFYHRRTE